MAIGSSDLPWTSARTCTTLWQPCTETQTLSYSITLPSKLRSRLFLSLLPLLPFLLLLRLLLRFWLLCI
jgi:hypothetical protein